MSSNPHQSESERTVISLLERTGNVFPSGGGRRAFPKADFPEEELLDHRFKIQYILGQGGFGSVFAAIDQLTGERIALKAIPLVPGFEDILLEHLTLETRSLRSLVNFAHVRRVHDLHIIIWNEQSYAIQTLEYIEGVCFREWLEAHRHCPEIRRTKGVSLFTQVCEGALALEEASIVPLDLKPENILLVGGEEVKLVDVFCVPRGSVSLPAIITDNTTPGYLAPEISGDHFSSILDITATIYALGIILYEILHPNLNLPTGNIMQEFSKTKTKIKDNGLDWVDPPLVHVFHKCLDHLPENRYVSIRNVLKDLMVHQKDYDSPGDNQSSKQVDLLEKRIEDTIRSNQLNEASSLIEEVLSISPQNRVALRCSRELQVRYTQAESLYIAAESALESSRLEEAANLIRSATELYPEHPIGWSIQIRINQRFSEYRKLMEDTVTVFKNGNWDNALVNLQRAAGLNIDSISLQTYAKKVSEIIETRNRMREDIDNSIRQGDIQEANNLAAELDRYHEEIQRSIMGFDKHTQYQGQIQ